MTKPLYSMKIGETKRIEARLSITRTSRAWVRVQYVSPVGRQKYFNLRPKQVKEIIGRSRGAYETIAENTYSTWIKNSKAGKMYADRNHVEGMLKTARAKGDKQMEAKLEDILAGSDAKVSKFWHDWYESSSAADVDEFFNYEPEGMDESGLMEGDYDQ